MGTTRVTLRKAPQFGRTSLSTYHLIEKGEQVSFWLRLMLMVLAGAVLPVSAAWRGEATGHEWVDD